jgi:hypothetical protein
MSFEDDRDGVAFDDDIPLEALAPFHDARPPRNAWRSAVEEAPSGKPVYARAPDSIRVLIALRDEQGWVFIRRDGELRALDAVAAWAPLSSAIY